ncbi:macrodomain Ter protein MatP, partial [Vibrio mimicus]
MKYQQLENLECGWKWQYLINKWKDGEQVTHYIDRSEIEAAVQKLKAIEHEPTQVLSWIEEHMSPELDNKLKQAIRAKRKRHFNAEQIHTRKKSIDLDYRVWEKLSLKANELGCTLSDAIEYLLSEASRSEKASKTV